jgi:hypothetical protein
MDEKNMQDTQVERATHVRIIEMENITCRNRRSIGETEKVATLADVAMMLDRAEECNIDNHGGSGIGAGAYLEATFGSDDPDKNATDGEAVETVDDPVFAGLPLGSARACRKFIADQKRSSCWDGNNHVPAPYSHTEAVLARIRGR